MSKRIHRYESDEITVSYDATRCIHAAECVRGLPNVFDPKKRPWVAVEAAAADSVADVVRRCPTGALHYERKDGVVETADSRNTVRMSPDGPLYVRGDIVVYDRDGGVVVEDTRVALCRCGASSNKPFCDMSHTKAGFSDGGHLGTGGVKVVESASDSARLEVRPSPNGPYLLKGDFRILDADGSEREGNTAALCRCGQSSNKPFCDGSHRAAGFEG